MKNAFRLAITVLGLAFGLTLGNSSVRADGWDSYSCGAQGYYFHSQNPGAFSQILQACTRFYQTSNPSIRNWNVQATVWRSGYWTPEWLRARRLGWDRCSAADPWSTRIDGSGTNYGQTSVQGNTTGTYQNCVSVHYYWAEDWGTMKPSGYSEQTNYQAGPS